MKKDASTTTLRLTPEQASGIKALAERYGVPDSIIYRWAVEALLQYAAEHDGRLHLPLNLSEQWIRERAGSRAYPAATDTSARLNEDSGQAEGKTA